ncbi:unnamed protein product [Didymodactylos carnosus]|uniref:Carbonic anhydrase n=1 Tax=Didymodactylos carnosus TaxID=1234261 RepID=A0A813SW86_9BILA|nr:unnamed protein product [Didymodactylos carnosus]CAF0806250.1 unnamed protein product [Didymodactylos carnosus]CAF3572235.1 unnamed protein product [Didymodactylos carnosus]CAF3591674.1 unnamed protein product [Didymodactylos carnosus]
MKTGINDNNDVKQNGYDDKRHFNGENEFHQQNYDQLKQKTNNSNEQENKEQEQKHERTPERKSHKLEWGYSILNGPTTWSKLYPELKAKRFQSPIQINTDQTTFDTELKNQPFVFKYDDDCCQTLENTGHSFQVSGKGNSCITGGPVKDEYRFLQFHMHWGANDLEGSEHVVNGSRYPAELHIVNWNTTKYSVPKDAAGSENFDGLMVLGVLVKISFNDNPDMEKLLKLFSKIPYKGDKTNIDSTLSMNSLLPKDISSYYTYNGSLTVPMCDESVKWIVFKEKIFMSRRQLDQLRRLKHCCKSDAHDHSNIYLNYRPVMPLNNRTVYRSFP